MCIAWRSVQCLGGVGPTTLQCHSYHCATGFIFMILSLPSLLPSANSSSHSTHTDTHTSIQITHVQHNQHTCILCTLSADLRFYTLILLLYLLSHCHLTTWTLYSTWQCASTWLPDECVLWVFKCVQCHMSWSSITDRVVCKYLRQVWLRVTDGEMKSARS